MSANVIVRRVGQHVVVELRFVGVSPFLKTALVGRGREGGGEREKAVTRRAKHAPTYSDVTINRGKRDPMFWTRRNEKTAVKTQKLPTKHAKVAGDFGCLSSEPLLTTHDRLTRPAFACESVSSHHIDGSAPPVQLGKTTLQTAAFSEFGAWHQKRIAKNGSSSGGPRDCTERSNHQTPTTSSAVTSRLDARERDTT